jgi:hypothetical protein
MDQIPQPYSYSVPSPHRLFKNSSTALHLNDVMTTFALFSSFLHPYWIPRRRIIDLKSPRAAAGSQPADWMSRSGQLQVWIRSSYARPSWQYTWTQRENRSPEMGFLVILWLWPRVQSHSHVLYVSQLRSLTAIIGQNKVSSHSWLSTYHWRYS